MEGLILTVLTEEGDETDLFEIFEILLKYYV